MILKRNEMKNVDEMTRIQKIEYLTDQGWRLGKLRHLLDRLDRIDKNNFMLSQLISWAEDAKQSGLIVEIQPVIEKSIGLFKEALGDAIYDLEEHLKSLIK
jgi:hypothetical protein